MNMMTKHIVLAAASFLAGHVVQAKVDTLGKITDTVEKVPVLGGVLGSIFGMLE